MISLAKGLMEGTDWEGKFLTSYEWMKACTQNPDLFTPCQAKSHEDHCAEWLSAQNINDWFDNHKDYLIQHEFVIDKPGLICEC